MTDEEVNAIRTSTDPEWVHRQLNVAGSHTPGCAINGTSKTEPNGPCNCGGSSPKFQSLVIGMQYTRHALMKARDYLIAADPPSGSREMRLLNIVESALYVTLRADK